MAAADIINGSFLNKHELPDLLPATRQMIMELAMPDQIKCLKGPISADMITEADFIFGFKKWKERTSTSPSGQHLGHYKAIIHDAADKTVERTVSPLSHLVTMVNLPLQYGFAPTCWCKSITVMIAKDS
jgi:hypothetical protein